MKQSKKGPKLHLVPVSFKDACSFIDRLHRHHKKPQGWKYGVGGNTDAGLLVGVAMVGRPVSRGNDDGQTLEVTWLCTDGTSNACSALYQACARAAKALGYRKIITYILDSEPGTSLKACGWQFEERVRGRSWSCPSRPRVDKAPLVDKQRWSLQLVA